MYSKTGKGFNLVYEGLKDLTRVYKFLAFYISQGKEILYQFKRNKLKYWKKNFTRILPSFLLWTSSYMENIGPKDW